MGKTLYAFYVYSLADAPENKFGPPYVKFHDLRPKSTAKGLPATALKDYHSIQLSLIRYKDFWNLIDPHQFCSTGLDVNNGRATEVDQLLVNRSPGRADAFVYTRSV